MEMFQFLTQLWMHWLRHAVDVLLVAYVFYRSILLIRGTRSVQVITGIVLLAIFTLIVVSVLHLPVSAWLLDKFWTAGIVLLAIVFQQEIRSALAQLGREPLARWVVPNRMKFIDEIVLALQECSDRRVGALIVLEQDTGLKNYIESGTLIHGDISTGLILALLHPRSPLHDGAIVISGNQIIAAGCVLPLTDDLNFAKILGTRHRAAVGLSEASDALILIVSEETGHISYAEEGQLHRDIPLDEIKSRVEEIYRERARRSIVKS